MCCNPKGEVEQEPLKIKQVGLDTRIVTTTRPDVSAHNTDTVCIAPTLCVRMRRTNVHGQSTPKPCGFGHQNCCNTSDKSRALARICGAYLVNL